MEFASSLNILLRAHTDVERFDSVVERLGIGPNASERRLDVAAGDAKAAECADVGEFVEICQADLHRLSSAHG